MPYSSAAIMFLLNGIIPPSLKEIELYAPDVMKALKEMASESVTKACEEMPSNAVVSLDGSWDHRRNGKIMILDLICEQTHKIVDYELVYKTIRKFTGNYEGPSNLMEAEAFKRMIPRLMKNNKIIELIKDGDVKISKIVQDFHWGVILKNDPNHQLLHFDTIWKKWNDLCNGKLFGLKERLLSYLKGILYETSTTTEKLQKWENAINHFTGNHVNCPPHSIEKLWKHRDDQSALESLKGLINDLKPIIQNFERYHTTNYNENFHSIKAHLLLKNNYQGYLAVGRIFASILQYNYPDFWVFKLFDYLHLASLPVSASVKLLQMFKQRSAQRSLHQSPEYKKKARLFKLKQKNQLFREITSKNILAHQFKRTKDK